MKKLVCLIFLLIVLTGCNINENQELSYSEVKIESVDQDVQKFINGVKEKNGAYLFQDAGEKLFVFLNSDTVIQGEKAIQFTGFDVKSEMDTVNIYFEEESTDEYANKELNNQVLYEVKLDKKYDEINLFRNNGDAHFTKVSGR